ncbi:hypothetical protein COL00_10335 [Bacillus cereus]|uniref:hypothetical protein n=1 Tax=Bacillus cereus TaxID=1396 RepID=UPI000BFA3785|nr:hypothetical protein [Bacillus cereus]PFV54386.1 hypothetical protein COL00_10335 [Bacillus cereus]
MLIFDQKLYINKYAKIEKYSDGIMIRTRENSFFVKNEEIYDEFNEIIKFIKSNYSMEEIICSFPQNKHEIISNLLKLLLKQKIITFNKDIREEHSNSNLNKNIVYLYGESSSFDTFKLHYKYGEIVENQLNTQYLNTCSVYISDTYNKEEVYKLLQMAPDIHVLMAVSINHYGVVGWFTSKSWEYFEGRFINNKNKLEYKNRMFKDNVISILSLRLLMDYFENKNIMNEFYVIDPYQSKISKHPNFEYNINSSEVNWKSINDIDEKMLYSHNKEYNIDLLQHEYLGIINRIEPQKKTQIPISHLMTDLRFKSDLDRESNIIGYGQTLIEAEANLVTNIIRVFLNNEDLMDKKCDNAVWSCGRNLSEFLGKGILLLLVQQILAEENIRCTPLNIEYRNIKQDNLLFSYYHFLKVTFNKSFKVFQVDTKYKNLSLLLFKDWKNKYFISFGFNSHDAFFNGVMEMLSNAQLEDMHYKKGTFKSNFYIYHIDNNLMGKLDFKNNTLVLNEAFMNIQKDIFNHIKDIEAELKADNINIQYFIYDKDPLIVQSNMVAGQVRLERVGV